MRKLTKYQKLLVEFAPRPIRTETQHRRALAQLKAILTPHPPPALGTLIDLLATLIEAYKSQEFPTPQKPQKRRRRGPIRRARATNRTSAAGRA